MFAKGPEVAEKVIGAWNHFDGVKYDLIAYVVMPNHVHLLIKTYYGFTLGEIVRSWKLFVNNFVAKNESLRMKFEGHTKGACAAQESGAPKKFTIWQREYWDRLIRDENHFNKSIEYIFSNPV